MPQTQEDSEKPNEEEGNFLSPDGMKLRSGKKKRRRSLDSSGLTPEEKALKRQRREEDGLSDSEDEDFSAKGGESDSEAATEVVHDEKDQQQKMPANATLVDTNGKHAPNKIRVTGSGESNQRATERTSHEVFETYRAAASRPSQRPHVVEKLRIPSKHTPGKLRETARLPRDEHFTDIPAPPRRLILEHNQHVANESHKPKVPVEPRREHIPPSRRVQQYENGDHEERPMEVAPFHVRCYEVAQATVHVGWHKVKGVIAQLAGEQEDAEFVERIIPSLRQRVHTGLQAVPVEVPRLFGYFLEKSRPYLLRTNGWFIFFLLFQICFRSFWTNHIWASTIQFSKVALLFYRGKMFSSPNLKQQTQSSDQAVSLAPELLRRQEELLLSIEQQLKEVANMQTALATESAAMDAELDDFRNKLQEQARFVETTKVKIAGTLDNMDETLLESSIVDSENLEMLRMHLGENEDAILDIASVKLWDVPDIPTCDGQTNRTGESRHLDGITSAELVSLEAELEEEVRDAIAQIKQSDEFDSAIRQWIADEIASFGILDIFDEEDEIEDDDMDTEKPQSNLHTFNISTVKNIIQARLDIQAADQTGRVDFAAVHNGAQVIRNGVRATSPSLVNNLPVFNRVASLLNMRFYGFGPEAALTSTYPVGSLGQCWAFEKDTSSRFSAFGTLTFRLAKPIYVRMISVEHPTREITDRINTAIRSFRVVGFEDPDASGRGWPLGSFEYDRNGNGRQEFDVEDEVNGVDVPKLSAISLDIDSNWGGKYACLYRVRVHGTAEQ